MVKISRYSGTLDLFFGDKEYRGLTFSIDWPVSLRSLRSLSLFVNVDLTSEFSGWWFGGIHIVILGFGLGVTFE